MATLDDILSEIDAEQGRALERLFAFLRIPSVSAAPAHFPDCDRAADWLVSQLAELGFDAAKHPTQGRPMVVGQVKAARRDAPHVLFYGHYDVQPADPLGLWRNPPFEPKLETGPRGEQHRCAGRVRRQRSIDDVPRGLPRLPEIRRTSVRRSPC